MAIFSVSLILVLLTAMPLSSQSPIDHATALSTIHSPVPRTSSRTMHHTPTTIKFSSTQTITSTSTSTSSTTPSVPYITETSKSGKTIYVKTNVGGCNMEGIASTHLNSLSLGTGPVNDILGCQGSCRFDTPCQSYSFDTSTSNCTFYQSSIYDQVTAQSGTGIFFSMKYPGDGSDYCYDDVPLPPASSSWLYPYPGKRALATGLLG